MTLLLWLLIALGVVVLLICLLAAIAWLALMVWAGVGFVKAMRS